MNNRKITLKEFEDKIKAKEEVQEALLKYISHGESEYVKGLLANVEPTADVNLARRNDGETPLMTAANKNFSSVMKILLEAKAEVNAKDKRGNTALVIAAKIGNSDAVKTLLEAKADINITADNGKTLRDVTKDVDCMVLLKAANPGLFKPAPVVAKAHDVPTKKNMKKNLVDFYERKGSRFYGIE